MAGLLYTNQTHKQLFISQSTLVPPSMHQFSLSLSVSPPQYLPLSRSTPTLSPSLQSTQPFLPPTSLCCS